MNNNNESPFLTFCGHRICEGDSIAMFGCGVYVASKINNNWVAQELIVPFGITRLSDLFLTENRHKALTLVGKK